MPWLVADGDLVWKVVALACLVLAVGGSLGARWLLPAVRGRRVLAGLGRPISTLDASLDGAEVTIQGRIRLLGLPARRFEDGARAAVATVAPTRAAAGEAATLPSVSNRAPELVVLVGGEPVLVEGPVEVASGSRERRPVRLVRDLPKVVRDRLGRADADASAELSEAWVVFRSLAPGDRTRLRGVLRRQASSRGETGYRQPAAQWVLTGLGEGRGSASRPRPVVAAWLGGTSSPLRAVAVNGFTGLVGLAVGLGMMWIVGDSAMASADRGRWVLEWLEAGRLDQCRDFSGLRPAIVASATPFHRRQALALLGRYSRLCAARGDARWTVTFAELEALREEEQ